MNTTFAQANLVAKALFSNLHPQHACKIRVNLRRLKNREKRLHKICGTVLWMACISLKIKEIKAPLFS